MKFDTCVKNIYNLQFSSLILKICIYDKFFFSENCTLKTIIKFKVVIFYLFIGIVVYLFFVWSLDGVNSVSLVIWGTI